MANSKMTKLRQKNVLWVAATKLNWLKLRFFKMILKVYHKKGILNKKVDYFEDSISFLDQ